MDDILIRQAEKEDLDRIFELEQICFESPWTFSMLYEDICENSLTVYLVVVCDDEIIGYGGMWIITDEAHMTNICILPERRGNGYAKQLMTKLCDIAEEMGAKNMTLEVRISNSDAIGLYRKCGFAIAGLRKKYYFNNDEDAYVMWREGPIAE